MDGGEQEERVIFGWFRKRPAIALSVAQRDLLDRLVERAAEKLGQRPEDVRRCVEIAVVTRGVEALKEELER